MSHKLIEKTSRLVAKKVQYLSYSIIILILSIHSLFSQATIPTLNLSDYDSNMMSEVYGQSYFMNSLSAWTDQVNYYQGLIRASWETSADTAIQQYVDSITTSDAYNDVNAYKDYVSRELNSQKLESLMSWEESANFDLLANRNEFVAKLNSSRVDEVYLSRLGMQDLIRPTNSEIEANRLREQLNAQANQWSQSYQQGYQNGLTDFGQSVQAIEDKYNTFLATMNQSEQTFTDNLTAINNFKTVVKQAIGGMMTSFQTELDRSCDVAEGCQYKNANQSWNSAGLALNDFVTQVNAKLNNPSLDSSTALTQISQAITTYLTQQTTGANSSYNYYNDRIVTYQISSTNIDRNGRDGNSAISNTVNGTYDDWNTINTGSQYRGGEHIVDPDIGNMVRAIRTGDYTTIYNTLQGRLGGTSGRSIVNIIASNVFTADLQELNKTDQFAYISKTHTRGNYLLENNGAFTWEANRAICYPAPPACAAWTDRFQMDHITYGIAYTMRDQGMADHASYWSGNLGSLSNQLNQYNTNINPAISNWESQVQNYNNFYTAWQTQAQTLRDQARLDYENSLSDLETKKQTWLNKIGQEYQDGVAKWQGLENQINQSSANGNLSAVKTNFQASVQSIGVSDFSTGTNTVLANYDNSYNDLTSREFTFTDVSTNQAAVGPYQYLSSAGMTTKDNGFLTTAKNFVNSDSFMLSGVADKLGISKAETVTETTRSYNIFSAAADKKVETSLSIKDKDLASVFQTTANGVYQYSQLLSTNENNANAAIREQEKLINQMSYGIRWEDRAVGQYDKEGNFIGEEYLKGYLAVLQKDKNATAKYNISLEQVNDELKRRGYEYQDGMIVKSFTDRNTMIKLGLIKENTLTDAEKRLSGSCYVNPTSCSELRQDYISSFNKETLQVTLTKNISNGRIGGRDSSGKYISGTQEEKRYVTLSMVAPVTAPNGKDLFDVWGDSDWNDFSAQASNVMNNFYTKGLTSDSNLLIGAVTSISTVESNNNNRFQAAKQAQQAQDSLIKDLILAYITGGMAGVNGAIKNKIEDQINTGIAEAWARASGADEDQIAMLAQAVSFMKGKMQERNIKTRSNTLSINNPIRSIENIAAKYNTFTNSVISQIPGLGTLNQLSNSLTAALARTAMGPKAYEATMNRVTGPKDTIAAIKANTESMIQSNVTQAVATSTGLPAEVIGNMITDYKGSLAAKKIRRAINGNPITAISAQIDGIGGGIIKTAANAFGLKDRDIQRAIKDGNRVMFSGNLETSWAEIQSEANANTRLGLKAPGTTYTSATPTLKNKEGLVQELGQRMTVDFLAQGRTKEEKEIINAALRKGYSAMEQRKADKKQQADAIRSTAITAVTTVVTLGAAAVVTGPMSVVANALKAVGNFVGVTGTTAVQVGAAVVKGAVQVIDGSRNGIDGMAAGFVNGAIGVLTAGTFDANAMLGPAASFLQNTGLGIGVSYDSKNKWGGAIGIGGSSGNASVNFSQRGDTRISAGVSNATINYNLHKSNYDVGYTLNVGNGVSLTANYDSQNGMSGTASFNRDGVGGSYRIDRSGTTASGRVGGNSIGSNGPNGFTAGEIDWVDQNLDQARDNVDAEMEKRKKEASESTQPMGTKGLGTSRTNMFSQFFGGFTDGVANMFNFYNGKAVSTANMIVDSDGKVHPRTCFTAGTKIHTIDGLKNIEEIKVDDVVLSKSDTTGDVEYKKVVNTFIRQTDAIYIVRFTDGTILETTWNHPFRRLKSSATNEQFAIENSEWVEAKDLKSGDRSYVADGTLLVVDSVVIDHREETVYNFEVEDFHTYFVGEVGVWVHNDSYTVKNGERAVTIAERNGITRDELMAANPKALNRDKDGGYFYGGEKIKIPDPRPAVEQSPSFADRIVNGTRSTFDTIVGGIGKLPGKLYDNVLSPIGHGIAATGRGIATVAGGLDRAFNGVSSAFLRLGDSIRDVGVIKDYVPFFGNAIGNVADMTTGLLKIGTEVGTLPLKVLGNPSSLIQPGKLFQGMGVGLNKLAIGAFGSLGTVSHAVTNIKTVAMETLGSVAGIGKTLLSTTLQSGLAILDTGLDTIISPVKMVDNLIKDRSWNEGLFTRSETTRDQMMNSFSEFPESIWKNVTKPFKSVGHIASGAPAVDPKILSRDDAALLAHASYSDWANGPLPVGTEEIPRLAVSSQRPKIIGEETGLDMKVFRTERDGKVVYTISFGGTENGTDWGANFGAVGGLSSQHSEALERMKKIEKYMKANDPDAIMVTTGHSLGGGLASMVSMQTGIPAITFNPAGTNFMTNGLSNIFSTGSGQIDTYVVNTDPLNLMQNNIFAPIIGHIGRPHFESYPSVTGTLNGHSIYNFLPPKPSREQGE